MHRLIQITQIIFCLVSMILTSLFALSLSGVTIDRLSDQEDWGSAVFLAILFVLIGCCIDIGKYLFWSQRQRSPYYGILSLVLMVFSWLASCAFLVTSEHDLVRESQVRSDQYIALQLRVESTRQAIAFHERLLEKRLGSAYHSQWEESEANLETIASLKSTLADLTEDSSNVGLEAAAQTVPTTRFFAGVGQVLNTDPQVVRVMGYGILSLLLELSTLGMIGLARTLKSDAGGGSVAGGEEETVIQNSEYEVEVKQRSLN